VPFKHDRIVEMNQEESLYIVRSWDKAEPEHFGISLVTGKREAERLVANFKSTHYLDATIEKYTEQQAHREPDCHYNGK
jgi:hypothetical protein